MHELPKAVEKYVVALGYRRVDPAAEIWAKPIGYALFVIDAQRMTIGYQFVGLQDGKLYTYASQDLDDIDPAFVCDHIRTFEVEYAGKAPAAGRQRPLYFLTREQEAEYAVEGAG